MKAIDSTIVPIAIFQLIMELHHLSVTSRPLNLAVSFSRYESDIKKYPFPYMQPVLPHHPSYLSVQPSVPVQLSSVCQFDRALPNTSELRKPSARTRKIPGKSAATDSTSRVIGAMTRG